jgi:hypothetical protein
MECVWIPYGFATVGVERLTGSYAATAMLALAQAWL